MSSDSHDTFPPQPSYEELWQTQDVQVLLRRHIVEQLLAGIYPVYNTEVARLIAHPDSPYDDKDELIQKVTSAELPLVVAADTGRDFDGPSIQLAFPLALTKVDLANGRVLKGSLLPVANIEDGNTTLVMGSFTQEQVDLLLRHANEQIEVGLHPELVLRAPYIPQ